MRQWDDERDDDFDDADDPEWDDGETEDEEAAATIDCPHCHAEIHEDSQRCPFCETYLSQEDAPSSARPLWIIVGVLICLALLLLGAVLP
jgi:uncharacterized paraquat-inducible protein A